MIKKNIGKACVILISAIVCFTSCTKEKYKVNGVLTSWKNTKIYWTEYNITSEKLIDSAQTDQNGEFVLKGKLQAPGIFKLYVTQNNYLLLTIAPGEKIQLQCPSSKIYENYQVEGSAYSKEAKLLQDQLNSTVKAIDSISKTSQPQDSMNIAIKKAFDQQHIFSVKFVLEHLQSPSSIICLFQQLDSQTYILGKIRDMQYLKLASDTLKKYFPESKPVKALLNERNRIFEQLKSTKSQDKYLEAEVRTFPEIKLPSKDGDTIKLSQVVEKSKLTLLLFWTPTNSDCVVVLKSISNLLEKYGNKGLEVYNVALFNDLGYWSNFIDKAQLKGYQVIDENVGNSVYSSIYNVQFIPSIYLINKEKGVLTINVFGEKLESEIKKHLGK
jgi:thiol-disulfide isomerase/thioredoxin